MIISFKIGDKIVLKKPTNIFEQIGIPSDLSVDETYTVSEIYKGLIDNVIIRIGLKERPYNIYYIELFEPSLKVERRQKLNKLNKI